MKVRRKQAQLGRSSSGNSAMAEFGPAMLIILMFFFFPMIDMVSLGLDYGLCMVLNYNQVHEAALIPYSDATDPNGSVMKGIPDVWKSGMGHFVKQNGPIQSVVAYRKAESVGDNAVDRIVRVQTTLSCNPFLPIPIPWLTLPGMNAPFVFSVGAERPMENPDYGPP